MSLGLIQKSPRAFGARTMKACVARSRPRVMQLKLKKTIKIEKLNVCFPFCSPTHTHCTRERGGGRRERKKRSLNQHECFSARLAVFGPSKIPQKKSKASGGPRTLVQSVAWHGSWNPPGARFKPCHTSLFWPQAAGNPLPIPAQCVRRTERGGAEKSSSELRPFPLFTRLAALA